MCGLKQDGVDVEPIYVRCFWRKFEEGDMNKDHLGSVFCCPISKGKLVWEEDRLFCSESERVYEVENEILNFYIEEGETQAVLSEDPNRKWLLENVAEGRDIVYGEYSRRLKGMQFVMDMLEGLSRPGFRVLEVGCGTGHFTEWVAEICHSESEIFTFDFSDSMLAMTKAKIASYSNVKLFKGNARGPVPFPEAHFDFILQRLAPFGPRDFGSENWAMKYLKPSGHYVFAAWGHEFIEFSRLKDAGYVDREMHRWEYENVQTFEEYVGGLMEDEGLAREEAEQKARLEYDRADEVRVREESVILGKKAEE